MSQSLRNEFREEVANTILNDIQYRKGSYYYFLGNVAPWGDPDTPTDPDLSESSAVGRAIRSGIVYSKRISPAEVSLATRRVNWVTGTVYDKWDHTLEMKDLDFYVMTDEFKVYKCLDNNNGAVSTSKPITNSMTPIRTADGYLWKYLYTIPEFKRNKFLSETLIPVQRALSDSFYNNGRVDDVAVIDQGSGYEELELVSLQVSGTTTGTGAEADVVYDGVGTITSVTVTNGGSGYSKGVAVNVIGNGTGAELTAVIGEVSGIAVDTAGSAYIGPVVTISAPDDPNGTTATATATVVDGAITEITVTDSGSGYTTVPNVTITDSVGTGSTATATISDDVVAEVLVVEGGVGYDEFTTVEFNVGGAVLIPVISSTGSFEEVIIQNPGAGYITSPTITIVETNNTGTGIYGNTDAVIEAVELNGSVDRVNIIDPGTGYEQNTSVTITASGDGTGASFTPVVYDGKIIDVLVEDPGTNYSAISLEVVSGTGSGAVLQGIVTQSDFSSDQSFVEQFASLERGSIYSVNVTHPGGSYSSSTYAVVEGNGTGAEVEVELEEGSVSRINVTSYGVNYTYADIVVIDPERDEEVVDEEDKAVAYAVLPPEEGHGRNALKELFADTLIINTPFRNELESFGILQDYRVYGIIKNPRNLVNGAELTTPDSLSVYQMRFQDVSGISQDDILLYQSNKYRVVSIDGLVVYLTPLDRPEVVPIGILSSEDGLTDYLSIETLFSNEFNKYSGRMLFFSVDDPFMFSEEQSLSIKTTIEF